MSEYVNHVVVCGYDESSHIMLDALSKELDPSKTRVVVVDDHERPRDLPPDFLWVQGDPSKESELDKVRLTHAAAVIVSGARDMSPQNADARTILIAFTIRRFLKRQGKRMRHRHQPLYVVAEILDSENVAHALSAGADEVVETRKIAYSMIAHAIRHHGTARTMSRFLTPGAHAAYLGQIPDPPADAVPLGDLLIRMRLSARGGLVIGLRTPSGEEVINPPKQHLVEPGTLLIYLAKAPLLAPPP